MSRGEKDRATNAESRGRPRDPETDRAILEAALRLISSEGYARMTMARVASEAGVSKPTIYLRYESKEDLATSAVAYLRMGRAPKSDGDLRDTLNAQMRHFRDTFRELSGMSVLGTALVEERQTPEFMRHWRERAYNPYRELLVETLERARERGEIGEDADLEIGADTLLGAYFARYLSGEDFSDDWPEPLTSVVLESLGG